MTTRPQHSRTITQAHYVRVYPGDDWYPCIAGLRSGLRKYVRVALYVLPNTTAFVTVWGADDTGVDSGELTLAAGLELYTRLAVNTCPPRMSLLTKWKMRPA